MVKWRGVESGYDLSDCSIQPRLDYMAGIAQSILQLAKGWTVRVSNPSGGEILRIRPVRIILLYGRGVVLTTKPPPPSAEVKERVQLYIYSLSVSSWPALE
jgi:hypothetical protein